MLNDMAGLFRATLLSGVFVTTGTVAMESPADPPDWRPNLEAFELELVGLAVGLAIPGLGYAVISEAEVIGSGAIGSLVSNPGHAFSIDSPIGAQSITKSLAGVVVMQLVDAGKIDLEAPVRSYLPEAKLPDEVLVKHLLTHTSEGIVGQEYVYGAGRYALLAQIIEESTGQSFEIAIRTGVMAPSGMAWFPSPGLNAAGGLISTTSDLARYARALDRDDLLGSHSMNKLAVASKSTNGTDLPVSLGWFTQQIQGTQAVWSYGQDDTSALVLRFPESKASLVLLAEGGMMSDAFRLLMGDVRKSPFAMSFFRLFVASPAGAPLPRPNWQATDLAGELGRLEAKTRYRYEDELIGQVFIELWNDRPGRGEALIQIAIDRYGVEERPDAVIHFAGLRLSPGPAKQMTIEMGEQLLAAHPNNRWILYAQAELQFQSDANAEAAMLYQRILDLPNQNQDFLHRLFDSWSLRALASIYQDDDPTRARNALQQMINCGAAVCPNEDEARRMLEAMNQQNVPGQ